MTQAGMVWIRWWIALAILWLLLVSKIDTIDLVAAAALAALVATVAVAFEKLELAPFRGRFQWLRHFKRIPMQMLRDTGIVFAALARQIAGRGEAQGRIIRIPFQPSDHLDREQEARTALVIAGVSLAPNTFVVGIDYERGELIVHQLVPTPESPGHGDKEWPI